MNVRLTYHATPHLKADCAAVVGSFNEYSESLGKMECRGNDWHTEFDLPPGEHYYKFLINHTVRLNDPLANAVLPYGDKGLWTPLFIDGDGKRLFNNQTYSVHIDSYMCGNDKTSETMCKKFYLHQDKQMIVRFGFTGVAGLHAVTALWYNPFGRLHAVTENTLSAENDKPVYLWFWNALDEPGRAYPTGHWVMKLFINGSYVLEDEFTLLNEYSYALYGYEAFA